jgi:hypothetical protein
VTEAQLAAQALAWLRAHVVVEWDDANPMTGRAVLRACVPLPAALCADPVVTPDAAVQTLIGATVNAGDEVTA